MRDDIKERQSTLKINAINIIYYLVIRDRLRFISHIIIMIKELTCVSSDAIKLTLIFSDTKIDNYI